MNIGPIEDRLAIRELIEAFAAAAMRLDANALGATWVDEGVWTLVSTPEPIKGRDNIVAGFGKVTAYLEVMSMICFPADLVIEGDSARGKAYCRELIFTKTGEQKIVLGCYDDRYVKRGGQWYFLSRTYEVMGRR